MRLIRKIEQPGRDDASVEDYVRKVVEADGAGVFRFLGKSGRRRAGRLAETFERESYDVVVSGYSNLDEIVGRDNPHRAKIVTYLAVGHGGLDGFFFRFGDDL